MQKEKVQKILLLLIVGFGLIYAYYTYLFGPQWLIIQQQAVKLSEREGYYQRLITYAGDISGINSQIQSFEAENKQLDTKIPARLDKPEILVYLYTVSKQHQVGPQKLDFGQQQNKDGYQEVALTFSASGKTSDVLSMIKDLQYSGTQRFAIQSVSLVPDKEEMLKADLKLTLFASSKANIENALKSKPLFMNYPFGIGNIVQMFK